MKRLIKWTFCFEDRQLEELKVLSKKSSVPQAVFVREALDYILKKYRYFLTMKKFNPEEARYFLAKSSRLDAEENFPSPVSRPRNRRSARERCFLGFGNSEREEIDHADGTETTTRLLCELSDTL